MNPFGSFTRFVERVARLRLSLGQRVFCRVAFDGIDPADLEPAERECAREIFGDIERIPPLAREVVVCKKGARIGGTLLCSIRVLHLALTVRLNLGPGESAFGVIVAPDLRLARQGLRYVHGVVDGSPELRGMLVASTADSDTIRRPDGRVVTIECLPATRGGSALRGRSLVAALLSEAALFRDETFSVNDAEVFKAVAPRIVPGGQVLIESTPWGESGLLYDFFVANFGHPTTAIVAHCPTRLMRDEPSIHAMIQREEDRDPDNFAREFNAMFLSGGAGQFFDARSIADSINDDLVLPVTRMSGAISSVGCDWGFVKDSTAAVAVQQVAKICTVSSVLELRPEKGIPLVPSVTVAGVAAFAGVYAVRSVVSDAHYRESIYEHLQRSALGLVDAPAGATGRIQF